jgi:hypothetical protein
MPCNSSKPRLNIQHKPTGGLQKHFGSQTALYETPAPCAVLLCAKDGKWARGRKLMSRGSRRTLYCLLPQGTSFQRKPKQIRLRRFHSTVFVFCAPPPPSYPAQLQYNRKSQSVTVQGSNRELNCAEILYSFLKQRL